MKTINITSDIGFENNIFFIFLKDESSVKNDIYIEFLLVSNFIMSSLVNWSTLSNFSDEIVKDLASFLENNFKNNIEFSEVSIPLECKRVSIKMSDSYLIYKSKGFSLFSSDKEMRFCGLNSIKVLISYYLEKRKGDSDYLDLMKKLILGCLWAYFNANLKATNKDRLAEALVDSILSD